MRLVPSQARTDGYRGLTLAVVVDGGSLVEMQMNKADQEGLRAAEMEALAVP